MASLFGNFSDEKWKQPEADLKKEDTAQLLSTLLEHYEKGCKKNGEEAEYAFLRKLWKIGRLYRFWKENGWKQTKDIIVRKMGDTHGKN